jgi:hypothetical protein
MWQRQSDGFMDDDAGSNASADITHEAVS